MDIRLTGHYWTVVYLWMLDSPAIVGRNWNIMTQPQSMLDCGGEFVCVQGPDCCRSDFCCFFFFFFFEFYFTGQSDTTNKQQILRKSRNLECGQPMTIQILAAKAIESRPYLHAKLSSQGFLC